MDETITRSLLVGLADEGLEEVLNAFTSRSHAAGETIVQMGDAGDELFLIVTGKVRVWTGSGPALSERTLSVLGPGEHFGEASMLSRGKRTATVTALSYVETLVLGGDDYRQLLSRHPQLLENISRSLTRRLSAMNAEITNDPKDHRRGVHSLAIIIDHPAGWSLAVAMLGQLRKNDRIVQPVVVCDGDLPFELSELDSDATRVTSSELGVAIASRSHHDRIAVAIASGDEASTAAVKECERVLVAVDAKDGLNSPCGQGAIALPAHRRPIVALMFESDCEIRSKMRDDRIRCIPVPFAGDASGQPHHAKMNVEAVTRIRRALMGTRIGLALGGGGAKGIAHVGVLDVFAKHGLVFDSLAGTSAGAIVAAAVAAGFSPAEVGQFFRDEMVPPKFMASRQALRLFFLWRSFRGGRFETKLRRYMRDLQFDQLALPLAITTVDMVTGAEKIRREGDLVNAVLQSINHPVFGVPIIADGELLVDGGVLINVPASVLRKEGCDYVISIDVGSALNQEFGKHKGGVKRPGRLTTLLRVMELGREHSSMLHRDESDYIIVPETGDFSVEDFHAVDELIEVGRRAGERHFAEVEKLIQIVEPGRV